LSSGFLNIVKFDRLPEVERGQENVDRDRSQQTLVLMAIGRHLTLSRKLYERVAVDFPMTQRRVTSGIGKTTFDYQVTYWEGHGDGSATGGGHVSEPLASVVYRAIYIDLETYRPSPLPKPFVEMLSKNLVSGGDRYPTFIPPTSVPETGTYSCRITVRHDDMDMLFHTTASAYLAFSLECAAQAAESGFYTKICEDVAFYQAKSTTSLHLGESRAGEELDVLTWEDNTNKLLLNFAVRKEGTMIYYAQVEFFDDFTPVASKL